MGAMDFMAAAKFEVARPAAQIVADAYAAFGQRNVGAVIDALTDDVVWIDHGPPTSPTSGMFHGKDEVQRYFELTNDTLDTSNFVVRALVADGDVVVAWIDSVATVKSNGKTIEGSVVHWWTLRDGKLATFDEFEHPLADRRERPAFMAIPSAVTSPTPPARGTISA